MSPSTAPLSCSLTRTARMVPLTRPQTVTSCAMMLPSICAPSPIRRSEARTSPSIRPKTCAGPLHSMLPTIDIPEPMQERDAAFVVGSRPRRGRLNDQLLLSPPFGRFSSHVLPLLGCFPLKHPPLQAPKTPRSYPTPKTRQGGDGETPPPRHGHATGRDLSSAAGCSG